MDLVAAVCHDIAVIYKSGQDRNDIFISERVAHYVAPLVVLYIQKPLRPPYIDLC